MYALKAFCHLYMKTIPLSLKSGTLSKEMRRNYFSSYDVRRLLTRSKHSVTDISFKSKDNSSSDFLRDRNIVPYSDYPSSKDVDLLYQFFDRSRKLVVLTGAGMSTESGIPDYRSPNGAYSTGYKPITHKKLNGAFVIEKITEKKRSKEEQEFLLSGRTRKRYWARSYAGWRRFTATQPNAAHRALASLEKTGQISFMITQNVDRLHHRAGSNPLELHGSVYSVVCLKCGVSISQQLFQNQVETLNPEWALKIEHLECDFPGSDKIGVQRPDADVEIDEKFWEEDFYVPNCTQCNGLLKPDIVFFGDNVPKDRADKAMEAARGCDAFLVLGSALMTMSAFRLVRAAHEAGATVAIINIGETRADDLVPLKISARCGEILPRLLEVGGLVSPSV